MNADAKQQDDLDAPDRGVSDGAGRGSVWAKVASALRKCSAPLLRQVAKHHVKIRRWGGLAGLAVGLGFMAGGLEPLGLSLILLGAAVLLVELERRGRDTPDRKR